MSQRDLLGAVIAAAMINDPGWAIIVAEQMSDGKLHQWLRTVDRTSAWTVSVCTGAFILAASGLLEGRRATTNWAGIDLLRRLRSLR